MNTYTFKVQYYYNLPDEWKNYPLVFHAKTYADALGYLYHDSRIVSALLVKIIQPNGIYLASQSELFNPSIYDLKGV